MLSRLTAPSAFAKDITFGDISLFTNYEAILNDYGFTAGQDRLYDTLTAYDYEIYDAMLDDGSPFIENQIVTVRQPDNLNSLILCNLNVKNACTLYQAVAFIVTKWYHWLRQPYPLYENIERITSNGNVVIRILTVSDRSACSIEFHIKKEQ